MAELLSDFLAKETPEIPMIIGRGILPVKGKLIIGGAPKTNKSFIVLNMALDLALGRPLFNAFYSEAKPVFPVYKPQKVLYIENEIGDIGLQGRLKGITQNCDMGGTQLYVKSRDMEMRMDTDSGRAHISRELAQVRPDVVFIDPLAKFHLADENSAQEMGAVLRIGDRWVEEFGCSIVYIHHTGHVNFEHPREGGDRLRGSTAIFADADSIMLVSRLSSKNCKEPILKFDFELRRDEALEPITVKRRLSGLITYEGEGLARPLDRETEPEFKKIKQKFGDGY